jgi:hypothetical protein
MRRRTLKSDAFRHREINGRVFPRPAELGAVMISSASMAKEIIITEARRECVTKRRAERSGLLSRAGLSRYITRASSSSLPQKSHLAERPDSPPSRRRNDSRLSGLQFCIIRTRSLATKPARLLSAETVIREFVRKNCCSNY